MKAKELAVLLMKHPDSTVVLLSDEGYSSITHIEIPTLAGNDGESFVEVSSAPHLENFPVFFKEMQA